MEPRFKWIVLLGLVIVLQFGNGYSIDDARAQNLVANPGMEQDSGWSSYGTPTLNERSNEQAHSGAYSRKFTVDAANEGIQSAAFTTVSASSYEWSAWVRTTASPPADMAWTQVAPQLNSQTAIRSLVVHNGEIYGSTSGRANGDGVRFLGFKHDS